MSFLQHLKDVRGELRHVSWPTQTQTIIYTVLVVILSLLTAAYLGFFDYVFTTSLGRVIEVLPQQPVGEFFAPDMQGIEFVPTEVGSEGIPAETEEAPAE